MSNKGPKEEFWDKECAPLIEELVEKCRDKEIPFFSTSHLDDLPNGGKVISRTKITGVDENGTFRHFDKDSSFIMGLCDQIARGEFIAVPIDMAHPIMPALTQLLDELFKDLNVRMHVMKMQDKDIPFQDAETTDWSSDNCMCDVCVERRAKAGKLPTA
jgi:hypothetical protein